MLEVERGSHETSSLVVDACSFPGPVSVAPYPPPRPWMSIYRHHAPLPHPTTPAQICPESTRLSPLPMLPFHLFGFASLFKASLAVFVCLFVACSLSVILYCNYSSFLHVKCAKGARSTAMHPSLLRGQLPLPFAAFVTFKGPSGSFSMGLPVFHGPSGPLTSGILPDSSENLVLDQSNRYITQKPKNEFHTRTAQISRA